MGPTLAMVQTLSPVNMRAVTSAILMLFINLIGMGLGPLLVGVLSDLLTPRYGEDALSIALACFTLVGLWGALHLWLCGRALAKQKAQNCISCLLYLFPVISAARYLSEYDCVFLGRVTIIEQSTQYLTVTTLSDTVKAMGAGLSITAI